MATFALVHGAWHGKWCWERLVPELESRGHRAIAMDLPTDDPGATFETYADVVAEHLAPEGEDGMSVAQQLADEDVLSHRYMEIRGELLADGFTRWADP